MSSPKTIFIPAGSIEYCKAPITNTDTDVVLDAQTVTISITGNGVAAVWLPAEWIGDPGPSRTARTTSVITWAKGNHQVYAKVGDSPESPIVRCGIVSCA